MTHDNVYKKFKECFIPNADELLECWYPNGKNSIRVRPKGKGAKYDMIFTYHSDLNYKFETINSYLNSIKVEVKHGD